jgi:riboflavin kinase/FMN adenylyltransferase
MQVTCGLESLCRLPPGSTLAIGNFDGSHLGHQRIVAAAQRLAAGGPAVVVTFEPHPVTVLRPHAAPGRLTPVDLKRRLLAAAGVAHLIEIAPEWPVLNMSAEDFWELLRDRVRPAHLVEGSTFTFGKGRHGTLPRLQQWARGTPIQVHEVPAAEAALLDCQVVAVSSSLVRWLLGCGRVRDAARCLGRPYRLCGVVVRGFGRGRVLGVPTANLECSGQLLPGDGVYAARCRVEVDDYPAALSIGTLPTFGGGRRQVEAHLLGFTGDLYGRPVELEMLDWVRPQRRFPNPTMLTEQIRRDMREVAEVAHMPPSVIAPLA